MRKERRTTPVARSAAQNGALLSASVAEQELQSGDSGEDADYPAAASVQADPSDQHGGHG